MHNREAEKLLAEYGYPKMGPVVDILVDHGYIVDIPISEPERLVEGAKEWLGRTWSHDAKEVFNKASGWSTASWSIVMDGEAFDTPMKIKNIFPALVIMAKEAGIDL